MTMTDQPPPALPDRIFARLPPSTRPSDLVERHGERWRVETAHLAEDLRDAKCVLVRASREATS